MTRSIRSKDKTGEKANTEESAEKLAVFDDKQEEREDEFIVKMLIRPVTESDVAENNGHLAGSNKQTLTQMVKKSNKTNGKKQVEQEDVSNEPVLVEDDDDNDEDDGLNNSISSQDLNNESAKSSGSKKRMNKLVYLCALEEGTKQKVSVLKLLYQVKPKYVILYDCVLWFVRQLEVYKTIHHDLVDMRVYFLMYTNSCEEQRYLTSVRCEKESFEILIREKAVRVFFNTI